MKGALPGHSREFVRLVLVRLVIPDLPRLHVTHSSPRGQALRHPPEDLIQPKISCVPTRMHACRCCAAALDGRSSRVVRDQQACRSALRPSARSSSAAPAKWNTAPAAPVHGISSSEGIDGRQVTADMRSSPTTALSEPDPHSPRHRLQRMPMGPTHRRRKRTCTALLGGHYTLSHWGM